MITSEYAEDVQIDRKREEKYSYIKKSVVVFDILLMLNIVLQINIYCIIEWIAANGENERRDNCARHDMRERENEREREREHERWWSI